MSVPVSRVLSQSVVNANLRPTNTWKVETTDPYSQANVQKKASRNVNAAVNAVPVTTKFAADHISQEHLRIIGDWIPSGWRPYTKDDALINLDFDTRTWLISEMDSMPHHPFYVSQDFNGDRVLDFAVVITNQSEFAVAIFNGPFRKGIKREPSFYSKQFEQGDLLFWMTDREFGNRFIVGPPASDAGYIIRPRRGGYVVE